MEVIIKGTLLSNFPLLSQLCQQGIEHPQGKGKLVPPTLGPHRSYSSAGKLDRIRFRDLKVMHGVVRVDGEKFSSPFTVLELPINLISGGLYKTKGDISLPR